MQLATQTRGAALLIRMEEARIDAASAIQFKEAVRRVLPDAPGRIVLDLGAVDFLDSSGLGALVAVMKLAGPSRRVELAALRPIVAKVLRLTRMDEVFTIHESADVALGPDARRHAG